MKAEGQGERIICDVKNSSSLAYGQRVDNKDGGGGRRGDEGGGKHELENALKS